MKRSRNRWWTLLSVALGVAAAGAVFHLLAGKPESPGPVAGPGRPSVPSLGREESKPRSNGANEALPLAPAALEGWAVRGGTEEPLAVQVSVTLPDGAILRTRAGEDGAFRLEGLPRLAAVDLEVSFPGLATRRLPGVPVPGTGPLEFPALHMGPPRIVAARILRTDGVPIPGALVELLRATVSGPSLPVAGSHLEAWRGIASGRADSGGGVRLEAVAPGHYRVRASAPGRAPVVESLLVPWEGDPAPVDLALEEGFPLAVEVVDPSGAPVAGARVQVEWGEVLVEGVSGDDGACLLEGLPAGSRAVTVVLPFGVAVSGARVEVPTAGRFRAVTGGGSTIEGRVRDAESGQAIPGAEVAILSAPRPGVPADATGVATAGPDGTFAIRDYPGDPAHVLAAAAGYLRGRWRVGGTRAEDLRPGGPFDLPLRRERRIRGTVRGEDGSPILGATVQLGQAPEAGGFTIGGGARVRPDGTFVLGGARPGPALVLVHAKGWWQPDLPQGSFLLPGAGTRFPASCSVVVPQEGEASLSLVLRRGGTVTGVLVDEGGSPLGGRFLQLDREVGAAPSSARTLPDGSFELHGIAPGRDLGIAMSSPGGTVVAEPRFDLPEGESVVGLRLKVPRTPTLRGVVLDGDGRPAAGAEVRVLPGRDPYTIPGDWPGTRSGGDGSFVVGALPGAPAQVVHVRYPGHGELLVDAIATGPGADPDPMEIRLERESPIRIEVVDGDGHPVAGAVITAGHFHDRRSTATRTGPTPQVRGSTDEAGRFTVRGLAAGPRVAGASAPGLLPDSRVFEGEEVRLVLRGAVAIEGTVREKGNGLPVAGAEMSAGIVDTSAGVSFGRATSDSEGRFRIEALRPARHHLHVQARGNWFAVPPREVVAGEGPVAIELERGLPLAGRVVDGEGRPVSHAEISVLPVEGRGRVQAHAGIEGEFRIPALHEGRYRLVARPNGWRTDRLRSGVIVPAYLESVEAGREDLVIRLERGFDLRGRIVDETGRAPSLSLAVTAFPAGPGAPPPEEVHRVKAEPDGSFLFSGLDRRVPRDLVLHGAPAGVGGVLGAVGPGGPPVTLVLEEGRSVTGRVTDAGGAPIAGIRVRVAALDVRGLEDGIRGSGRTDREGTFTVGRLGIFRFRVDLQTGGTDWAPASAETSTAGGEPLEFRLLPGAVIEGRVLGEWEGRLSVQALLREDGGEWVAGGVGEEGTFRIRGLAPGPYRLRVERTPGRTEFRDAGSVEAPATNVTLRWE